MMVKCEYCGSMIDDQQTVCPHCGATNLNIKRTVDHTPQTIAELKQWYQDRHLPPYETTRFFIGIDYQFPRAFGIYQDGNEFVVYKNKADGSRAIRYRGTDEAYAVNELLLKLKSEILNQKARNSSTRFSRPSEKAVRTNIIASYVVRAVMVLIMLGYMFSSFFGIFDAKPTYYRYMDHVYCEYKDNFYEYNTESKDYQSVSADLVPDDLKERGDDFEFDSLDANWNANYSFMDSDYYEKSVQPYERSNSDSSSHSDSYDSDSDSDYDWDSGSSWDSGGSDWSSDW
ncbi:MAG: zinc ribbon domain-containing protein [Eubacterium sp.]|nr:zinc ribbon domain-containing protein [Eubacterium sp.]